MLAQKAFAPSAGLRSSGPVRVARLDVNARESRIGSRPITIPKGVSVTLSPNGLSMKVQVRELHGAWEHSTF